MYLRTHEGGITGTIPDQFGPTTNARISSLGSDGLRLSFALTKGIRRGSLGVAFYENLVSPVVSCLTPGSPLSFEHRGQVSVPQHLVRRAPVARSIVDLVVPSSVPINADKWYEYIGGTCTTRSPRNIRHSGARTL